MIKKKAGGNAQLGTIAALVIMCVILSIANKNFYSYSNIMGILKQTAFNAFLATGMLLCLITAGIDLSVGANAVFCACVMGAMNKAGVSSGILMILVCMLVGALVGCVNGLLLTRLRLPHPFVSTLGMKNVLWGLALIVTNSQMVNNFPKSVQWLGKNTINGFPVSFILVILMYVVMHIFLSRTSLGRSIYCTGGNLEATRLSGINTANVLTFCYCPALWPPLRASYPWDGQVSATEPTPPNPMIPTPSRPASSAALPLEAARAPWWAP